MNIETPSGLTPTQEVEYFQELADGLPVMIWMSGRDMGCFYFNRAWLQFRGRSLDQEFGNGWAEGVHPEDLARCVQHYMVSFQQRLSFAMSYRLLHHSGEYRWILDRGAPHYGADGTFLGFYGGCAETPAHAAVSRITDLHQALREMRSFAERLAVTEAQAPTRFSGGAKALEAKTRLTFELCARQHAAAELGKLATDMLAHDRIPNGACLN